MDGLNGNSAQTNLQLPPARLGNQARRIRKECACVKVRGPDQKKPDRYRPGFESLGEDA